MSEIGELIERLEGLPEKLRSGCELLKRDKLFLHNIMTYAKYAKGKPSIPPSIKLRKAEAILKKIKKFQTLLNEASMIEELDRLCFYFEKAIADIKKNQETLPFGRVA